MLDLKMKGDVHDSIGERIAHDKEKMICFH